MFHQRMFPFYLTNISHVHALFFLCILLLNTSIFNRLWYLVLITYIAYVLLIDNEYL